MVSARRDSKSLCKIDPPLIVFDKDGNYLLDAKKAFEEADIHSITASF